MKRFAHLKLNTKFIVILSVLLIGLFLITAIPTYQSQKKMARNMALEEGRSLAQELMIVFNHMSEIVRDEPKNNYALVPQVVTTQIARKISIDSQYSIRQVSQSYRNPANRPDAYETRQLKRFDSGQESEIYRVTEADGEKVYRYMKSMIADESCLKCHGSYDAAPTFIQERFPEDHPSYGYQVGDVLGAVSFVKPMTGLYDQVSGSIRQEIITRAGILLTIVLAVWIVVHRLILARVHTASNTIHQITTTGRLDERIPDPGSRDEIGQLLTDFNTMMTELDRTTLQREESENRYRSLIEASQSAIVTFLENGKIVISNQQAEKLFGLSREKLLGESIFDYLQEGKRLQQQAASILAGQDHTESGRFHLSQTDGLIRDVEITLMLASEAQNKPMFTAILRTDIA